VLTRGAVLTPQDQRRQRWLSVIFFALLIVSS
jgi:hypothetical protein